MTKTQVEVITSVQPRRWSRPEKGRIVVAALEPGAVLRRWRGQPRFIRVSYSGADRGCVVSRRALQMTRWHFLR